MVKSVKKEETTIPTMPVKQEEKTVKKVSKDSKKTGRNKSIKSVKKEENTIPTVPVKQEEKADKKVSKNSKKTTRKNSFSFEERLVQCKEFIKKHGHCKIPTNYKENKSLGIWVQEVRGNFKAMMEGKKPRKALSMEEIDALLEIEFHFGVPFDPNKFPETDASWERSFAALKKYNESEGNFDVPITGDLAPLGKWARVQRTQKYYRDTKRKCFITKERVKALDGIGFNWKGPRKLEE